MGTWAVDAFGNDDACDWTYELDEANDLSLVDRTFDAVLAQGPERLEMKPAVEALVAVEVVARLQGHWGERSAYTDNVDEWVERTQFEVPNRLARKAHRVIERVLGEDSALKEFWHDWQAGKAYQAWLRSVEHLRNRVQLRRKPNGDTVITEAADLGPPIERGWRHVDPLAVLQPMTREYYRDFWPMAVAGYAKDNVASGRWPREGSLERSQEEFKALLPEGLETPNNYFYEIKDLDTGASVGSLWFAVQDLYGRRTAFLYDVRVHPQHRRNGHASRAFDALEPLARALGATRIGLHVFEHNSVAQALYSRLGYEVTGLNMLKHLKDAGG